MADLKFNKSMIQRALDSCSSKAKELLDDHGKLEEFLQKLEKKLAGIPNGGEQLAMVPTLISMVRATIMKEYKALPSANLFIIMCALVYLFVPFDFAPDALPLLGLVDDAAVIGFVLVSLSAELDKYREWRALQAGDPVEVAAETVETVDSTAAPASGEVIEVEAQIID